MNASATSNVTFEEIIAEARDLYECATSNRETQARSMARIIAYMFDMGVLEVRDIIKNEK